MDENTFSTADSVLDKFVELVNNLVLGVEKDLRDKKRNLNCRQKISAKRNLDYLVVRLQPVQSQITNSNRFPVVADLLSRSINDMCHFIRNEEFEVLPILDKDMGNYLGGVLVSDKETVFDLDRPEDHTITSVQHLRYYF